LNNIWALLKKDLLRDARHPWGLAIFMIMPVLTAIIIGMVFSPRSDIQKSIRIDVAVLDRDDDLLTGIMRSVSNQGEAGENLRLHFVETEEAGIRLVERRKVSAFVVFPENLTVDLLEDRATAITLYKNPAESILPKIVEEGLGIVCNAVSQALILLQPELTEVHAMIERDEMPPGVEVAAVAANAIDRLKTIEPYLFPPLIQFNEVSASEYTPSTPQLQEVLEDTVE
jgi:hypothetical protein